MHSHKPHSSCFRIEFIHGGDAHTALSSEEFRNKWANLAAACPWGTACQTWEFAAAWLSVYHNAYEPLLLVQYDETGQLIGLLALAIDNASGAIVHVGAHQAEYQVWLARRENAESFIETALDVLALAYPGRRMKLQYLPPESPIGWCKAYDRWGARTILHTKNRPLLTLGAESPVEDSLRKRSNKSRLNRLKKIGPLRLVQMHTRAELEPQIDTIAEFCDLRQGVINSSFPFRDDPCKREFCLRMMESPGISHATALMVGDTLAAANIGLVNRTSVSLGIVAHSPFLAEHSPGKILILMLARELGLQGFKDLDLTPGGDMYKDRSADHYDEAYSLSIFFNEGACVRHALRSKLQSVGKRVIEQYSPVLAVPLRQVAKSGVRPTLIEMAGTILHNLRPRPYKGCHEISPNEICRTGSPSPCKVNCITDLLCYEPATWSARSKSQFLQAASRRLEAGDCAYTVAKSGILYHCSWVSIPASGSPPPHESLKLPAESCLLWEDYTHPDAVGSNLSELSMNQRLQDAAHLPGINNIFVLTDRDVTWVRKCCGPVQLTDFGATPPGEPSVVRQ